ncbi:MAG: protein kinase [Gammaproteobacteria bacterium]|nr:protein kinase [Gammaproteobacteria bacterium]NIX87652.1 protein kinase [Gammaproteobacteria bacterium]
MASVYAAIQESLNRPVALKILNESFADTPEFTERFLNEGRVVASLSHRNIITIYDIDVARGHHYISMEYVEGGDLKHRIADGVVSPEAALELVATLADCLAHAHRAGIVHRDVTPANILFRQDDTPLLTDFGIAKTVCQQSVLTVTGDVLGTPGYLSPERAEGKSIDGRADIYSLGIVLYEMLVGQRPYEADSSVATILKHLREPIPRLPSELEPAQPLLNRMIAKRPEDRFQSAEELLKEAEALRRSGLAAGMGAIVERPPTRAMPVAINSGAGLSPRRWAIIGGIVACLALFGLGFSPAVQYVNAVFPVGAQGVDQETRVARLLALADRALVDNRLTVPAEESAWHYYREALALDPGNARATAGFGAIAGRYAQLAERQIEEREYAKAEQFIERGLAVQPGNERLLALRRETRAKAAPQKLIDNIKSLFGESNKRE